MKEKKCSWIVKIRETATVEHICEDCTEEEARKHPHSFSKDENIVDLQDWEVISVKPNT